MSDIAKETSKNKYPALPEGCTMTKAIRDARFRIAHITRDLNGNFSERHGWLVTDVVCNDPSRVCIQYDQTSVFLDVPAIEIVIMSCTEGMGRNA